MPAPQPGSIAPDFSLPDAEGNLHSLHGLCDAGPLWLTFFKISCPTCQSSLHFINRLPRAFAGTNAKVWTVSQDPLDHTRMFNAEFAIDLPQIFDSEEEGCRVSAAYGLEYVPTTFLIDPGGRIAQVSVGWDRNEFEAMTGSIAKATGIPAPEVFNKGEHVDEYRPGCGSKN